MHIIQCPHCLTHTSLKSSLLISFEIFPIGFDALFHSFWPRFEALWKFFFCDGFEVLMVLRFWGLVTLVLISSIPWKCVPLRIPFSFGKRKNSQGAKSGNKVDDATWWFLSRPRTVSRWGLCGQEHCRDVRSKFFLPRKLFVFDEFCWQDESELPCKSVG